MDPKTPTQQTREFPDRLQDLPPGTPRAVQAFDWMRLTVIASLAVLAVFGAVFSVVRILTYEVPNALAAWILVGALLAIAGALVFVEARMRAKRMSFVAGANSYAIYRGDDLAEILPSERIVCYRLSLYNTFLIGSLLAFIPVAALVAGVAQPDLTLIITGIVGGCLTSAFLYKRLICRWIQITGRFFDKQIALQRQGSEMFG